MTPSMLHATPNGVNSARDTALPLVAAIIAGDTLAAALAYHDAGISTIPVKVDGSKTPALSGWRQYALRQPTVDELHHWHSDPARHGIGATGGAASGNLAVLDFETWRAFTLWGGSLSDDDRDYLKVCPVVVTPKGGAHVWGRTAEPVKGMKLARTPSGETLIEVRGSQHFVVAPGSPAPCHPTGNRYRLVRHGWLAGGAHPPIPLENWERLGALAVARNEYRKPCVVVGDRRSAGEVHGDRPGDEFNRRARWSEILEPHGWREFASAGDAVYWCRPGKKPAGVSASTGFCTGDASGDLFYVFSTSAAPFEAETAYSRFAVYAVLNHRGDFAKATRALGLAGYGKPLPRVTIKGVRR